VGIGLVALSNAQGVGDNTLFGDSLTLISAIFFGLQIIFIDKFQNQGHDTIRLLVVQLLTVGVIFAVSSVIFELPKEGIIGYALSTDQILKIGYLTLACTLFAQFAEITGQKFTSPNQASIVLSLESVFGVLFSVIFAGEILTPTIIVGFVVIFMAIMISELKLNPLSLIKYKKASNEDAKKGD
jgi:drug/metabolite transporter (DMT)-like permease